jgi:hypothetical protein
LDAGGNPLPHLFAIGLAAGFVPHGKLGGEASFRGQANGLWLWQSDVGGLIVDAVLSPSSDQDYAEPFQLDGWEPVTAEPFTAARELEV